MGMRNFFCWAAVLFLSIQSLSAAVTASGNSAGIVLENKFVRLKIVESGGRIASLVNKKTNTDLLAGDNSIHAGLGKVRDIFGRNLGFMTGSRQIRIVENTPRKAVVETRYTARGGLVDGLEVVKTYTLNDNSPVVEFSETYRSKVRDNRFIANWHNRIPVFDNGNGIDISTASGVISFAGAVHNRNNYIFDPRADFLAFCDKKSGNGMAVLLNEKELRDSFYVFAAGDHFSLECNFRDIPLRPVVGADEWKVSGSLIPFTARGRVLAVNGSAVAVLEKSGRAAVTLLRDLGRGFLKQDSSGRVYKEAELLCNSVFEFDLAEKSSKVTVSGRDVEFDLELPPADAVKKDLTVSSTPPAVRKSGEDGIYYYYPEMFLTPDITAEIMFGIKGDFRKKKNFRMALCLPENLEMTYASNASKDMGIVEINGRKYRRYEIFITRKNTYHYAVRIDLLPGKDFRESELYVMALWENGAQTPQKVPLRLTEPFPEIGKGLKKLKIGLGVTSDADKMWKLPDYHKIGVNFMEYWEYLPKRMFLNPLPDGAFSRKIRQAAERNIESYFELGGSFTRPQDALAGIMTRELGTLHHPVKSFEAIKPQDIQAIDCTGKPVKLICPSVRGRYYSKTVDSLKSAIDYGFDNIAYDEEVWSNGAKVCFCKRCKDLFRKFLTEKYPSVSYQEPEITVREAGKYPALEDAWWDFKTSLVTDIYQELRRIADTYRNPERKRRQLYIWLSSSLDGGKRYGAITDRLTDYKKFGMIFDWVAPMMYTDSSAEVGKNARAARRLLEGTRGNLIMGLCPNRYYEYFRVESQSFGSMDVVLEQILEAFFNGARGVVFWSHRGGFRGTRDFRNVALAVKMIMPVEDILLNGKEITLKHSNPAVTVSAWEWKGEIAVFLRNYDHNKVKTVLDIPVGLQAFDTLTGKKVGKEVVFGSSRIKVLHLRRSGSDL